MLGSHPLEDVMHLGSWIQLFTILHAGAKPEEFQCFPTYNGRPPELVCGRTYPLLGLNPNAIGTICLGPDGRNDAARITLSEDGVHWHVKPLFDIQHWFERIRVLDLMVAPLVFRHHAVFRDTVNPRSAPYVAVDYDPDVLPPHNTDQYPVDISDPEPVPRQFLSHRGTYTLAKSRATCEIVAFPEAHQRLLPLGTFILVETSAVQQFGIGSLKHWIRGSLRYPDEEMGQGAGDDAQLRIYITVRIRVRGEDAIRVIYAPPESCRILSDTRITEAEYSIDAVHRNIRVHGAAVVAGQ